MSTMSYYYSSPQTSPRPSLHHLPPQLSSCLTVTAGFYVGMFLGVDRHYVGTCVCNSDWNCVATFLAFLAFYEFVSWHVWSGLHELSLTSRAFWDTSLDASDWHYVGTFIGMSEWHDVFSSVGISGNVSPVQLHPILQPASWDTLGERRSLSLTFILWPRLSPWSSTLLFPVGPSVTLPVLLRNVLSYRQDHLWRWQS